MFKSKCTTSGDAQEDTETKTGAKNWKVWQMDPLFDFISWSLRQIHRTSNKKHFLDEEVSIIILISEEENRRFYDAGLLLNSLTGRSCFQFLHQAKRRFLFPSFVAPSLSLSFFFLCSTSHWQTWAEETFFFLPNECKSLLSQESDPPTINSFA